MRQKRVAEFFGRADELVTVARYLSVPHEPSHQGIPLSLGIIERGVPDVVTATRIVFVGARWLGPVGSYGAPCYMPCGECLLRPPTGEAACVTSV